MAHSNVSHLQRMMDQESAETKVIAITSGKGGVGKSNIAANLAICMAASNKTVNLIDADLGLGNLDVIMNVNSRYNLSHVISGGKSLSDIIHIGPAGVGLICGGSGIEEMANMSVFQTQRLLEEMDALHERSEVMLIDTGAGINKATISFCMSADQVLVVTTPEPTAMTDAYAMIKVLSSRGYDGRISIVVNMANSITEGKKIYRQIADVANRFLDITVYEAGVLCRDDKLLSSVRARKPVVMSYPKANITGSLVAMAARLTRTTAARTDNQGFFRKVVNWFF